MISERALQQTIHVACRQMGIDSDMRRDLQLEVCGKASMRDMNHGDLTLVVRRLERSGLKKVSTKKHRHPTASRADLRLIHVLWKGLGNKGILKRPARDGLNAFIRARFEGVWDSVPIDVDALRDHGQISQVIEALKSWGKRVDIDFDWEDHAR